MIRMENPELKARRRVMKFNIYYGGRGIMGDPTAFALTKMTGVFEELNVKVVRYNLHEEKKNITTLPSTLNDADGVILASTVEWIGIGGYMMEFLDACWYYGNKEKIASLYMCPLVMSTTYGEREGQLTLMSAWDMLGGKTISGLTGYIKDTISFEMNQNYISTIEKTAENFYRAVSKQTLVLPASNQEVKAMVSSSEAIDLTPQETEQLSKYASDENFVQTQKEDIRELADQFKTLLKNDGASEDEVFASNLRKHYKANRSFEASFKIEINGIAKPMAIEIHGEKLRVDYETIVNPMVVVKLSKDTFSSITSGELTFQKAFMTGEMQVKGDFSQLRTLDEAFPF